METTRELLNKLDVDGIKELIEEGEELIKKLQEEISLKENLLDIVMDMQSSLYSMLDFLKDWEREDT